MLPNPWAERDMEAFDRLPRSLRDALNAAEFNHFSSDFVCGRGRMTRAEALRALADRDAEMKRCLPVSSALPSPPASR